jgi:hypothetical protein
MVGLADSAYGFGLRLDSHPACLTMVLYELIAAGFWTRPLVFGAARVKKNWFTVESPLGRWRRRLAPISITFFFKGRPLLRISRLGRDHNAVGRPPNVEPQPVVSARSFGGS